MAKKGIKIAQEEVNKRIRKMQTLFMLSDSQWDEVKAILEPKPRRRQNKLQVVVSGIIYLLENGCKWEGLPPVYGNFKSVWYYFHKWTVFGVLEKLLFTLNQKVRAGQGKEKDPSLLIVDWQRASGQMRRTLAG